MASEPAAGDTARACPLFFHASRALQVATWGACAMLPRIIGQGRAAELLYTGRSMNALEGERWGFWNALHEPEALETEALCSCKAYRAVPPHSPTASPRLNSSGMEHEPRTGDRGGSTGRRRSACRLRISIRARLHRVRFEAKARIRRQLTWRIVPSSTGLFSMKPSHARLAQKLDDWCAKNLPVDHHDVDAACRSLVKIARSMTAGSNARAHRPARSSTYARSASCAKRSRATTDSLTLLFRHAGTGHGRADVVVGERRPQRTWLDKTRRAEAIAAFVH